MNYKMVTDKSYRVLFSHYGEQPLRGSEKILLRLLKAFQSKGHKVFLICNQSTLAEAAAEYCDSIAVFQSPTPNEIKSVRIINYFTNIRFAYKLIKQLRVDVVIANNLGTTSWMTPATLSCAVPMISYLHANYLPRSRLTSLAYSSSAIIGVSDFAIQDFLTDRYPWKQTFKIWNGTTLPEPQETCTEIRKRLGIPPEAIVGLCIGAVVPFKRMDIFTEASREVSLRHNNYIGLIVGDGALRESLEHANQISSIRFIGWVGSSRVDLQACKLEYSIVSPK